MAIDEAKPTRILLAEDHRILREVVRTILSAQPDLQVVGEAGDGSEAIHQAKALQPDLVLLDQSMPVMNGIGAIKDIKRVAPRARVMIMSVHTTVEYVFSAVRAGVHGYISKDASAEELVLAARRVAAGQRYLGAQVAKHFVNT